MDRKRGERCASKWQNRDTFCVRAATLKRQWTGQKIANWIKSMVNFSYQMRRCVHNAATKADIVVSSLTVYYLWILWLYYIHTMARTHTNTHTRTNFSSTAQKIVCWGKVWSDKIKRTNFIANTFYYPCNMLHGKVPSTQEKSFFLFINLRSVFFFILFIHYSRFLLLYGRQFIPLNLKSSYPKYRERIGGDNIR